MTNGFTIGYKDGNVLDAEETIIVHGCNAQGVMGSGVAKAIRAKYPGAYELYRQEYEAQGGLALGTVTVYDAPDGKVIINGVTQEFYGRDGKKYVDYTAVREVMEAADFIAHNLGCGIAMPMIGSGLGGGSWTTIENIIEVNVKRPVTVYRFKE